jgi:hypothetical protein
MRTPSGAFVLFQFCGEHKGQVQFRRRDMTHREALTAAEIDRLLALNESQCQVAVDTAAHDENK